MTISDDTHSTLDGEESPLANEPVTPAGSRLALGVKELADRLAALVGLIVLSPLLLVIAVAIAATSPGPVFFRQRRVGWRGQAFSIFKFRTMVAGAEKLGMGAQTSRADPRVTAVGRVLRKLSLDELPQLINILRGEMSLIGPRPTLPYQVERYTTRQRGRLLRRPGVTGWAQIHGRKSLSWPERIEYDIWYVEHWSLWLDLQIALRTIPVVLGASGVDDSGAGDEISRAG
jgi:undecaprenyl phosphate N,N'-diacetylbacillosamine 1-phosphate transferase